MDKKVIVLWCLLGLLVTGAFACWWLLGSEPDLAGPADVPQPVGTAAAASAAISGGPMEASLAIAVAGNVRATAATATGSTLPFPEDAQWVPVLVVDGTTREPVAGANVGWVSESIEHYFETMDRHDRDLRFIWRSLEQQIERAGWRTTSDEHGLARVTFKRWSTVVAEHEGRYGEVHLLENTVPPPGGYVLVLEPDRQLTVQVVDEKGEPAPDVLLAVGVHDQQDRLQHLWGWSAAARTRKPDGTAVLRHLQRAIVDEAGEMLDPSSTPRWHVRTYVPGFDDPGVEFLLGALPAAPIVLRLPACGRVRARAEVAGRPAPGFYSCRLAEFFPQRRDNDWNNARIVEQVDADGWVRFPYVPLGHEFTAASYGNGSLTTRFTGPTARDQELTVVIAPANDTALFAGRILDGENQPARDALCRLDTDGPRFHANVGFMTDEHGRFLVALGEVTDNGEVERVQFDCQRPDQPPRRIDLPGRTLRPGIENLGDLVLTEGKLIAAGRLVDEHGPYRHELSLWVERFDPIADPENPWQAVQGASSHQDGTGAFDLRGTVPPGRLRLVCAGEELLPMEPVEFEAGVTDLEVHLAVGHRLAASLLVAKGTPGESLVAQLVPTTTGQPAAEQLDEQRFQAEPWGDAGDRLHLQWSALPAGSYRLELRLWTRVEPLLAIADVHVPGPEGGDARLADIDLRELVRVVALRLFDANGKQLDGCDGIAFAAAQDPGKPWRGSQIYDSLVKLVVPTGTATEVLVAIDGFRPARTQLDGDHVDLRLEPWPMLELTIVGLPELPPKVQLMARTVPVGPSEGAYQSQWGGGDRSELFDAPARFRTVDAGHIAVPIGDGPHRIELSLGSERHQVELTGLQPEVALSNSGRVQVTVPAAQWTAALAEIAAAEAAAATAQPK